MASQNPKVTRSDRVAALELPPGQLEATLQRLRRGDVVLRICLCGLAAILLWTITGGWYPPFAFRTGAIPPREIIARTDVSVLDESKTQELREQTRRESVCFYTHDPQPFEELRKELEDRMIKVTGSESFESVDTSIWREFVLPSEDAESELDGQIYQQLRSIFENNEQDKFDQALQNAWVDYERSGLLKELEHQAEDGSFKTIRVHLSGNLKNIQLLDVDDVRLDRAHETLDDKLTQGLRTAGFSDDDATFLVPLLSHWLKPRLPTTLRFNSDASHEASEEAVAKLEPVMQTYYARKDALAPAGEPLSTNKIALLKKEHAKLLTNMTWPQVIRHSLADLGMYVALFVLCGTFITVRRPDLLHDLRALLTLLFFVVVTVGFCWIAARDQWRAELIPLTLFALTATIAYRQELALLLSASMALMVTLGLGQGIVELVVYFATMATTCLLLDRVRSRTKLIYVGLAAAVVTAVTTLGVGTVASQSFGGLSVTIASPSDPMVELESQWLDSSLLGGALWYGFLTLVSGILMTGLLPFVERGFDVQTDLSLLELGDAAHPLLQELVRRAPGTYNHSINVASMAEAAADSIGANGLLVRVGAYFHDIGKMLKPQYFIENQGQEDNRHEHLLPAMSTLVIIAHVKDGADLARQHGLPRTIIEFIEQHHGTTLVEYFYRQAEKAKEENPDEAEVDENNFRYPGPKPQSREAGVMMLADAVESASRTLVDPTPARIENLVHKIALNKLQDGQFDECGLTLRELNVVEDSLVKSLTSVYHGRIKYPDQQTA